MEKYPYAGAAKKLIEWGMSTSVGLAIFWLQPYLFARAGVPLLDPMAGLVMGLGWRGRMGAAVAAALIPLTGGWETGGPEAGGLLVEAFLTFALLRSVGEGGGIGLRGMILLPLATGVTVAGTVATQIFSGMAPFDQGFGSTWASQALGVMALAPLVAKIGVEFLGKMNRALFLGWVLLSALLLAVGRVASWGNLDEGTSVALALIPLVILFWQAIRFGAVGAATTCLLLAILLGLAWADGTTALRALPAGMASTLLATVFGTAHGMAALREEREERQAWTGQAAQNYQIIFWRWQRGQGVEWDKTERAAELGLGRKGSGWGPTGGWVARTPWPSPEETESAVGVLVEKPDGQTRWLEFAGVVQTRDTEGQPTTRLGVVVDRTAGHRAEEEKNKRLVREGELRAIRAQLQPHVVFNALNRIASLTMSEPESARDLIVRLSRLLRASLLAGEKDSVSLSEEVSLIQDCVALEGAGYGERLKFHNEIPSDVEEKGLPPLALLSLVNGAIRRGVGMRKKGASIVLSMPKRGTFRVTVTPPVSATEQSEFAPWPDPVWVERLGVETTRRARIVVQLQGEAVASADLVMER